MKDLSSMLLEKFKISKDIKNDDTPELIDKVKSIFKDDICKAKDADKKIPWYNIDFDENRQEIIINLSVESRPFVGEIARYLKSQLLTHHYSFSEIKWWLVGPNIIIYI